jgi:hypothetical protein
MADTKISDFTNGVTALLTDEVVVARSAANRRLSLAAVVALATVPRNLLINGNFVINQRTYVSGAVLAAETYGHDRWKAGASGGDYSFTQLENSTVVTIASGKSLIQVVENKMVEGGSYVLSWTGTSQARYAINSATPAGSYAASPIAITGQNAGTTMSVEFNNGTLGEVMLAPGTAAATFERRPYSSELAMCKRYLPSFNSDAADDMIAGGQCISTTAAWFDFPFEVEPRVKPTGITASAAGNFSVWNNAGTKLGCTGISYESRTSRKMGLISVSVAAGLTSGNVTKLVASTHPSWILWTGCEL